MTEPVDLTNLRTMTDGDAEMEKALFEEFFLSFEVGIAVLQASLGDSEAEAWRKQSHALKGIALNLGAAPLGGLCKKAQDEPQASADAKAALVKSIRAEYELVKPFLLKTMALHQGAA